jgi:phosphoribosylformimino-5-aminoimidazole carboxamide ribotide isomerase
VQVGGGLRSAEAIEEMLAWGATRVVIGTKAATDPALVGKLLARHGPERLAVGIDSKNGQVAVRGWTEVFDMTALQLAERVRAQGARTVIYTDVARDGMLTGPDVAGARALAERGLDVIASGGVASLDDLRAVRAAGLSGAIIGRALYEGRFTLPQALACIAA